MAQGSKTTHLLKCTLCVHSCKDEKVPCTNNVHLKRWAEVDGFNVQTILEPPTLHQKTNPFLKPLPTNSCLKYIPTIHESQRPIESPIFSTSKIHSLFTCVQKCILRQDLEFLWPPTTDITHKTIMRTMLNCLIFNRF